MIATIAPMSSRHQLPSYPLRMEEELREKIAAAAKASGRSMNAEIAARLEGSFSERGLTESSIPQTISDLKREVIELRESLPNELMHTNDAVATLVHEAMESTGLGFSDALLLIASKGLSSINDVPVVIIQTARGATLREVRELFSEVNRLADENAHAFYLTGDVKETKAMR